MLISESKKLQYSHMTQIFFLKLKKKEYDAYVFYITVKW